MHVFVTGATGWVGSAIVDDLLGAGHQVTGFAHSMEKAAHLVSSGADIVQGSLDDLDILREAAASVDAIIHTAFNHDFTMTGLLITLRFVDPPQLVGCVKSQKV